MTAAAALRALVPPSALLGLLLCQVAPVKASNFWGHDEWLIQHLLDQGIIDVPYANRPLGFLWLLPIPVLSPHDLRGWTMLYLAYAWGAALLVHALIRRLVPERPLLALAGAALFLAWSPSDQARLACFERTEYMGFTCATLLALAGFTEAWLRRSEALLALAILVGFATARSYEGTLPLLLGGPLLLAVALPERPRAFWRWFAAWEAFGALVALLVAMPLLVPVGPSYQRALGLDPNLGRVLRRLAGQYAHHLGPLLDVSLAGLWHPSVALSAGVFLVGAWLVARRSGAEPPGARSREAAGMAVGLAWAGLGYALFSLNREAGPWRKQFFAGPGIALVLACALSWVASWLPGRLRRAAFGLLVAGIVALGCSHTTTMQRFWELLPFYRLQTSFLADLVRIAPDVRPHTLFVLLDEVGTWRSAWGFRHAAQYLYDGRASGWAYGTPTLMYPTGFTAAGVVSIPWAEVQRAWRQPASLHRYEELVVLRRRSDGRVEVLGEWPSELPPLPSGARYAPGRRIVEALAAPASRAILGDLAHARGGAGLSAPRGSGAAVPGGR